MKWELRTFQSKVELKKRLEGTRGLRGVRMWWKCCLVLLIIVRKLSREVLCMIYNTETRVGGGKRGRKDISFPPSSNTTKVGKF